MKKNLNGSKSNGFSQEKRQDRHTSGAESNAAPQSKSAAHDSVDNTRSKGFQDKSGHEQKQFGNSRNPHEKRDLGNSGEHNKRSMQDAGKAKRS